MRLLTLIGIFFYCNSVGQRFDKIDELLLEEKSFQALFQLHRLQTKNYSSLERFQLNNRKLEAWLITKESSKDSIETVFKENRKFKTSVQNGKELDYFNYLEAYQLMGQNKYADAEKILTGEWKGLEIKGKVSLKLGELYRISGRRFKESDEQLNSALIFFRRDSARGYYKIYRCHLIRAVNAKDRRQYTVAERGYALCLKILDNIPEPMYDERARVLNNLGNSYNESSKFTYARLAYEESINIRQKYLKDSGSLSIAYSNMAGFLNNNGYISQSEIAYEKAMRFMPAAIDQKVKNTIIYNYCTVLFPLGENEKSKVLLDEASRQSEKSSLSPYDVSIFRLRNSKVENAIKLEDAQTARIELALCFQILKRYPADDPLREECYLTASDYFAFIEENDSSRHYAMLALSLIRARHLANSERLALAFEKCGENEVRSNQPLAALASFHNAYEIYKKIYPPHHQRIIYFLNSCGIIQASLGNLDSALYYGKAAVQVNTIPDSLQSILGQAYYHPFESVTSYNLLATANFKRYEHSRNKESLKLSEQYVSLAIGTIQIMRNKGMLEGDRLKLGQRVNDVFSLAADIYFEGGIQFDKEKYFEIFFHTSELVKSQILQANLKAQKIQRFTGVAGAIQQKESELFKRLTGLNKELANQLTRSYDRREQIDLVKLIGLQESENNSFLDSLKNHLPDYFELKYDRTLVSPQAIQSTLPKGTALVEYMEGRNRFYVMIISAGNRYLIPTEGKQQLKNLTTQYRNLIQYRLEGDFNSNAHKLYKAVFSGVDSVLSHEGTIKSICIIPDGILNVLPFEALLSKSKKKDSYIISKYNVSYNSSATLFWQKLTDTRPGPGEDLIGIAPSFERKSDSEVNLRDESAQSFHQGLADLKESGAEVEMINNIFSGRSNGHAVTLKERVSESDFKKTDFSKYRYIHLATHGFADTQQFNNAGLAFSRSSGMAEDDILFANEVFGLQMPCDLVTLSACETGLGKFSPGEGLIGLTRSFFYAGSKSIVVSLWKVQDNSTALFMKYFYSEILKNGKSKTEALRSAKLKMLKDKKFDSPYFWAPFILSGGL